MRHASTFKLISTASALALAFLVSMGALTIAEGQEGSSTISETTEPPPRTIIPEQKSRVSRPARTKRRHTTPASRPKRVREDGSPSVSGRSYTKCDLPGGCEPELPPGAITLEQVDALRSGGTPVPYHAPAPTPVIEPLPMAPPAPMPTPRPYVALVAGPAVGGGAIYESTRNQTPVLRHYIPKVSDSLPRVGGPAPAPAPIPAPAPAPTPLPAPEPYAAPAPMLIPAPAPAPVAPATVKPSPMAGGYKSDLPGYEPEPLPPGTMRLEDVRAPGQGYTPPPAVAPAPDPLPYSAPPPAPMQQADQFEEVRPPSMPGGDPQQPPSRWEQ